MTAADLPLAFFFSSTLMGGIVVNLVSMVKEIVFSTGAFFSGAADGDADAEEAADDDEADADSVSRGGTFSADWTVGSSPDELPAPNNPFNLPGKKKLCQILVVVQYILGYYL
jgi:hypothetical protein